MTAEEDLETPPSSLPTTHFLSSSPSLSSFDFFRLFDPLTFEAEDILFFDRHCGNSSDAPLFPSPLLRLLLLDPPPSPGPPRRVPAGGGGGVLLGEAAYQAREEALVTAHFFLFNQIDKKKEKGRE